MSQISDYGYAHDEIDLLDLIKTVWKARWVIIGVALVAALVAFVFTVIREPVYEGRVVFAVQSQMNIGLTENANYSTATLVSMIRSRQLAEIVADNLDLTARWEAEDRASAVQKLLEGVSINADNSNGIITIAFRDPDPVLAHDVVAAYVFHFEELANELNVTEADQLVAFARARLEEVERELLAAEAALLDFKERYGIADFELQASNLVSAHAELTNNIRMLTMELAEKRTYLGDRDPTIQALQARIAELERQRQLIETDAVTYTTSLAVSGNETAATPTVDADVLLPNFGLRQLPFIASELQRLEGEVTLQREIYNLLRQHYEMARLEASRKLNIVRLIDPPTVPDRPVSRGVVLNVALALFTGAFAGVVWAFVAESLRRHAQDEDTVRELPFLRHFRQPKSRTTSADVASGTVHET